MASQKINFAYCTTKSTYDSAIADGRIKDTDVVFVEHSRGLFTHGIDFSRNIPIINQAGSSIQLDPDKLYVLSDLQTGTLEINLNEVNDNVMHEYLLQFTTGNTAPTLDVPDGIK